MAAAFFACFDPKAVNYSRFLGRAGISRQIHIQETNTREKFYKAFALLVVFFAFSAATANAQINYRSQVEIPFSFSVHDRTYDAGSYIIKINKTTVGGAAFTIQKEDSNKTQTVLVSDVRGTLSSKVQLVFNVGSGSKYLSGITTSNNSYAFSGSKALDGRATASGTDIGSGTNLY